MNKKRLWTRGAAWLLTLCLLAGLCVPTVRAEGETEPTGTDLDTEQSSTQGLRDDSIAVQGTGTETSITGLGVEGLGVSYVFSWEDDSYKASLIEPKVGSGQLSIGTQSGQFLWYYYYGEVVLTLTNTLSTNAVLSFNSSSSGAGESYFNEASLVPSYSGELKAGDSVTFRIRSAKTSNGKKSGILLTLDGIKLEPIIAKRTTSFLPMSHGSYTVDGENVVTEMTKELESNKSFHLNATPDRGYILAGWQKKLEVDGTATVSFLTDENPYDYYPQENATIQPMFVPADSAIYMVGTTQFVDLNYANDYAVAQNISTIVLAKSGTVPAGDYEISKGVSLLIPYSDSTTLHISEPTTTKDQNGPSGQTPYRTLTMKEGATIRVYGTINVDSEVTGNRSEPTGPYGYIVMETDSHIILESGANLACWGFISGDGEVRAKSGSTVYECFQMPGWRGGKVSQKMTGNKQHIFPVNKYAVQNIEASYAMESGATEKIYASVYLKQTELLQGQGKSTTDFIATDSGMFRLTSGELVRKYSPSEDRVNYDVNGELVISQLVLNLSITIGITLNIRLDTQEYVMPLSGNFTININKGTTSIDGVQDLSLMPGAKFIVSEGATFKCSSALFAYDHEAYIGKSYAYPNDTATIPYSPTKGYTRKADLNDMPDAEIDVNGTLLITSTGTLYTTVKLDSNGKVDPDKLYGANIHSSQGTGSIVFQGSADSKKKVYEFKGNDASVYETVPITPARLRNGDGSYVETSSVDIKNGVAWTYFYDRGATEQWYRFKIQFVMKDNPDVIVYQELVASDTASVKLPGLNGTVTTEIAGGKATSKWDAASKTLTLTSISPTIPTDGSAPVLKVTVDAAVNSYKPYFVLNEKQYGNYRSYTWKTLTDTVEIGGKTYYVVQSSTELMQFGKELVGPTDESMGVNDNNHNGITWFLEDTTDGAQVFIGTVPSGETEGGPVYIYGIYSGYEVKVTRNGADEYYTTLKEAVTALPQTGSATVQMLANCGTFEDESKTASYSFIANITFDLNGKEVWGSLVNNGTLTLDLNGGSVVYQTGATAQSSIYRASAPIVNNGTLTIQDTAGGGKITIDAIEDNGSLQNYVSAVRNLGTLTMTGITAETSQTVNDYSAVVLNYNGGVIETITDCHLIPTRGYGILNYGATITEISGGNIDGGSSSTVGRYGIRNHNLRTGTQQSKDGYSISKEAKIGTIKDVQIYVYQYGIRNYATIEKITGDASIQATNGYGISNEAGWYYDTQVKSSTEKTSGNVKTTIYTYDTTKYPTIDEISGNTTVTVNDGSYALWNAGDIGKISGVLSGTGVQFTRNGSYVLQNSGNIGKITGKVTISGTNGQYVLSQNLWGSTNARCVAQTYIQKDVNENGTYTDVGDVRDYTYEYIAPVIGTIGGGDSKITISGTSNVFYNFGTVTNIFDGVTITATGSNALVNGTGGGYATWHTVRTNMGYDTVKNRYETRVEEVSTRYQAQIGEIIGNVVIEAGSSAITNGGLIEEIGQGVTVKAKSGAIQNTSVTYTSIQRVFLGYDPTYVFGTRGEATNDYAFTADTAEIRKIDGATIQATAGNGAINNGGLIETITNSRISATGNYAVNNTSNVVTARKIYKDNTLAKEYALTEIFDKFFKEDSSGTYTSVAGSKASNRIDTYAKVPMITTIGEGNTITAAKQAINNSGEITNIAGTEDSKTSVVATATAKDAMAIYNASALCGKVTVKDGASVSGDYKTAAYIRKLENLNVSAAGYGIQNGDGKDYLNVIDEIGTGVVVTSKNNNAVYNASNNAQIKSISGGVYTAQTSGQCAVNNASTTYAITISDGDFKGGTSGRTNAIYDPDNTARQTYPTGYTLSGVTRSVTVNGTAADGYYFVTKNEFTIVFDGNPATTVSGSVASITVSRTDTSVTLPSSGFTREGFEQVGWALTADTGADSSDLLGLGATVTLAQLGNPTAGAEVRLYAVWKPNKTYSITVTWSGDLSYTYTPAVYRWNGATMKYQLESAAYWSSTLGTGKWPSVTVKNAGTDSTKEGTVAVTIAYTRATNYNALNMEFTVGDATTTDSATLSSQLSLRQSASATMKLTGTPPNETANGKVVGSVKLTLTPTDG